LDVSIIFLRSAVLATLAMVVVLSCKWFPRGLVRFPQQCGVELLGRKAEA
jgi:hypothetical protein